MKIIDYDIVAEDDQAILLSAVKDSLSKGWQPLGAMTPMVDPDTKVEWFYQTMVKYK